MRVVAIEENRMRVQETAWFGLKEIVRTWLRSPQDEPDSDGEYHVHDVFVWVCHETGEHLSVRESAVRDAKNFGARGVQLERLYRATLPHAAYINGNERPNTEPVVF